MLYIISQILGWVATVFRAGGMLAKKPMTVKLLVSVGKVLVIYKTTCSISLKTTMSYASPPASLLVILAKPFLLW